MGFGKVGFGKGFGEVGIGKVGIGEVGFGEVGGHRQKTVWMDPGKSRLGRL